MINSLPGVGTGHTWQIPGIPGHLYAQICPGMQSESLLHNLFLGSTVQRKSCLEFANDSILFKLFWLWNQKNRNITSTTYLLSASSKSRNPIQQHLPPLPSPV